MTQRILDIGLTPRTRAICLNLALRSAADRLIRYHCFSRRRLARSIDVITRIIGLDLATTITYAQDIAVHVLELRRTRVDAAIATFHPTIATVIESVRKTSDDLHKDSGALHDLADDIGSRLELASNHSFEIATNATACVEDNRRK